ncbi:MAG: hypothetical protein ACOYMM_13790 [Phycisphaerales bacterium]
MMPSLDADVSNNLSAALLLAGLPHLRRLGFDAPTATAVLAATGAGRSRAYELVRVLEASLDGLVRPVGRPAAPVEPAPDTAAVSRAAIDFLIAHPGAITYRGDRRHYSDGFRALALRLVSEHPELKHAHVGDALCIPAATLDDWLTERRRVTEPGTPPEPPEPAPDDAVAESRIAAILHLWRQWEGGFSAFADAVRRELEIPWGDTRIGKVLAVHGDRRVTRRPGRRSDEKALRESFETFFPGAQWTEDGTPLALTLNGERFDLNLELVVDTHTAALVGAHVGEQENRTAVIAAFDDAVATTGAPPLALGTDNATENDLPKGVLGETRHIWATPGRPQNDAHVEGAFGLFQQVAPPLVVEGKTPRELAAAILTLVVTIWGRTLNHRPRRTRGGRSRVELYRDGNPTPDQINAAKETLDAIQREHDRAVRTRQSRADPTAKAALDAFFDERGWKDPKGHLRCAIAGYALDSVLAALATWQAKEKHGRLPEDAGARYLLAIARNIHDQAELTTFARALWQRRLDARDLVLLQLQQDREAISGTPETRLDAYLHRLITSESHLGRAVWTDAIADLIRDTNESTRTNVYGRAVSAIAAAYAIPTRLRHELVKNLAEQTLPVAA